MIFNTSVTSCTYPIFCAAKHPVRLRDTAGRRENTHKASERIKAVQKGTFNTLPLLIVDEIGGVPAGRGGLSLQNITCYFPTPLLVAIAPLSLPYILRCKNTPQCCRTRQGRRLECFVLLRRKLQKLRNVLYSSSAHECAIGEVSVRTEGLKTTSYQSVYTGHIPFSPAVLRSITGHSREEGGNLSTTSLCCCFNFSLLCGYFSFSPVALAV